MEPIKPTTVEKILETRTVERAKEILNSGPGHILLVTISFLEAALPIPIITDPFLIAAILSNRAKTAYLVVITTISSVFGGFFAYLSVLWFRDILLGFISPGLRESVVSIIEGEQQNTFILTIIGAVTPVPYTIIGWAVALIGGSPLIFVIASLIGRGFRYTVVGWSVYKFGPVAVAYAKRSILVTSAIIFLAVILYFLLKLNV